MRMSNGVKGAKRGGGEGDKVNNNGKRQSINSNK